MKLTANRPALAKALATVCRVVQTKHIRPIAENVLLQARDDGLMLTGTDIDVTLRYLVEDANVVLHGEALVPAHTLSAFVNALRSEVVDLELLGNTLFVGWAADRCELPNQEPEEFPIPPDPPAPCLDMPCAALAKALARTSFAASDSMGRYAMHGLRLEQEGVLLRVIGTDGRRLAVARAAVEPVQHTLDIAATIPRKAVRLLPSLLADEETCHVGADKDNFSAICGPVSLTARLIDGEFPRWRAVLPKELAPAVVVDRAELIDKLLLVSAARAEDAYAVRLVAEKGGKLSLAARSSMGSASAELEAEVGAPCGIAFNPGYLLDGLKAGDWERAMLRVTDSVSPVALEVADEYEYVVMPVTVEA